MELSITIILSIFVFFQNLTLVEVESDCVKQYPFSFNQIPKKVLLTVTYTIKVDQGASTFWMHALLGIKGRTPNSNPFLIPTPTNFNSNVLFLFLRI